MTTHVTDASALGLAWRKSSYSGAQSNCVEATTIQPQAIALRDSKRPTGPALVFGSGAIRTFLHGIRHGHLA
jgi:hypothetical protein